MDESKEMTDREMLQMALDVLEKRGYETHARFMDCSSCAGAALKKETTKWVYWHEQDDDNAFGVKEDGWIGEEDEVLKATWKDLNVLVRSLNIRWNGDANEIQKAFQEQGFLTKWDGDPDETIEVLPIRLSL